MAVMSTKLGVNAFGATQTKPENVSSSNVSAFDKDKISHNFKISPVDWNAQRSPDMRLDNEQEEFVFSGGVIESNNYFKKKAEKLLELMKKPNISNQEKNAYYEDLHHYFARPQPRQAVQIFSSILPSLQEFYLLTFFLHQNIYPKYCALLPSFC